jgi:hypothetical protein
MKTLALVALFISCLTLEQINETHDAQGVSGPIMQAETDGSILFANWTQNEIVFAADSRRNGVHNYQDTQCKLGGFGDKIIFGATGRRANPAAPASPWDIYAAAKEQFARISHEHITNRIAERFAIAWGDDVKNKFQRFGESAVVGLEDNGIASALFADLEPDETVLIVEERVTYDKISGRFTVSASAKPEVLSIASIGSHGLGKVEIFNELNEQKTLRSAQWGQTVSKRVKASFDHIAEVPIAVVDLTIKNLPHNHIDAKGVPFSEVGPPVAAVRLRRGAGIDWPEPGTCETVVQ